MAVFSLPVSYLAVRAREQAEQSFETTVVGVYAFLVCVVFLSFAAWFGLIEPRLAS